LDGRQDRAHHRHRASEIQDRHDEPRLQHPPAGSARANGSCTRLSALTGGVRVASCKRPTPARRQNGPRSGTHLGTSAATAHSAKTEIAESEYCSRFPYVEMIAKHGLVAIHTASSSPLVAPPAAYGRCSAPTRLRLRFPRRADRSYSIWVPQLT